MKKLLLVLLLVCSCISMMARDKKDQDKLASANMIYHTDSEMLGVNFQAMFPIGSNIYIAPDLAYFFPKSESYSYSWGDYYNSNKITYQALNLNADFHYPLYVGKKSFISPLLGFGGYIGFVNVKDSGSATGSLFHANIGLAGKFALTDKVFFNTQAKYLRPLQEGVGLFSFTAGVGFFF